MEKIQNVRNMLNYTWKFIIHDKLIVYRRISRLDHKYTNIYHKLTIMVLDILIIPECNNG